MRMRAVIAALSRVFALVGSPVSAQPLTFITLDPDASNPSGINDSGDIVGTSGRDVYYDCDDTTCLLLRIQRVPGFGERAHDHRAPRPGDRIQRGQRGQRHQRRRRDRRVVSRYDGNPWLPALGRDIHDPRRRRGDVHRGAGASVLTATLPAMG